MKPVDKTLSSPLVPPPPPMTPTGTTGRRAELPVPGERLDERETIERIRRLWAARKQSDVVIIACIHYTHVEPILQEGPMCGIVALAMISSLVTKYTAKDIFQLALDKEYTLKGEMFNASDLYALAHAVVGEYFDITMITKGLKGEEKQIIKDLIEGALYLVPYDADKDDSPSLFNGHRAHWAVLCGVIEEENGKFIVLARQGKSKHVGLWAFDKLYKSNANLMEISPARLVEGGYKIHDIGKTLAGHCIRLKAK